MTVSGLRWLSYDKQVQFLRHNNLSSLPVHHVVTTDQQLIIITWFCALLFCLLRGVGVPVYGSVFGYLYKLSSGNFGGSKWKRKWCVLQGDELCYWKSVGSSTDPSAEKTAIKLCGYSLHQSRDVTDLHFKLVGPHRRTYEFSAETREQKEKWVDSLTHACSVEPGRRTTFSRERGMSQGASSNGRTSPAPGVTGSLIDSSIRDGWMMRLLDSTWIRSYVIAEEQESCLHVYRTKSDTSDSFTIDLEMSTICERPVQYDDLYACEITTASGALHVLATPDVSETQAWLKCIQRLLESETD
eukprot:m.40972 g.40972  ORF g.40972 m.40972 type:complete len:300 (-) comp10495_c0_seq1:2360-3259(-)